MVLKCHNPALHSGDRKDWKRTAWCLKGLRSEDCNWNVAVLMQEKKRDFIFVLKESGEEEVGGGTKLWKPAKSNSKLLWGLKWVPINHPLLFWKLFHLEFYTFQKLPPREVCTKTWWSKHLTPLTQWHWATNRDCRKYCLSQQCETVKSIYVARPSWFSVK